MDYHSRVLIFCFPNEVELVWVGYNSSRLCPLFSNLKAYKIMSKGLLHHIVSINNINNDIPSIEYVPQVNEF